LSSSWRSGGARRATALRLGFEADFWTIASGAAAAQIAFAIIVWIYGESPREMAALVASGTWGSAYGIGQVLFKATPLLFTGLAVHVALRAGLFNVGAEGQLAVASLAVGAVGAALPASTPWIVAVPLLIAIAALAGALWAAPAAALRSAGAHEVISTILLNRVADAFVGLLLGLGLAHKGTVRTADVAPHAHLSRLSAYFPVFEGTAASTAIAIAFVLVAVVLWILPRTRAGREAELVAQNEEACRAEGISVRWRRSQALLLSGAIAGLASLGTVLGYKGYFEQGLGAGAGFTGLAVAILGRGRLAGIVFAALLFGTLAQGGLAINAYVPSEAMEVIQGVVIVVVALGDARLRAWFTEKLRALVVTQEGT
jgi:simple sugar transport system permease protein